MNTYRPFSSGQSKRIHERLDPLEKGKDPHDILLDNADLLNSFKICRRTLYNWRRKGLLKYLLIEGRVFYRLSDVREFLERSESEFEDGVEKREDRGQRREDSEKKSAKISEKISEDLRENLSFTQRPQR